MTLRIDTSGWQYADWRGVLYPAGVPQRRWLALYVEAFDTVEINATFYRLPKIESVQRWADTVPRDFVVTIKASRYLTHVKRLREPAEPVSRLLSTLSPLRRKGLLGPILLQTPPDLEASIDDLRGVLREFPADVKVAFEPRDASWFTPDLRRALEPRNAALVWADRGGEPLGPNWVTADWCYLRLHHGRHSWRYDDADLDRWARRLHAVGTGYAYTNNDPAGPAVADAQRLRELLGLTVR
jgi:uncharacterized protein YecE (DUF72 family)